MEKVLFAVAAVVLLCRPGPAADEAPVVVKKVRVILEVRDGDKDAGTDLLFRIYNPDDGEVLKLGLSERLKAARLADDTTHELTADWKAKPISVRELRTAGYSADVHQVGRSNPHCRLRYSVEVLGSDDAWYTLLSSTDPARGDYQFPPGNPDRLDIEENEGKPTPSRQRTQKVKLK